MRLQGCWGRELGRGSFPAQLTALHTPPLPSGFIPWVWASAFQHICKGFAGWIFSELSLGTGFLFLMVFVYEKADTDGNGKNSVKLDPSLSKTFWAMEPYHVKSPRPPSCHLGWVLCPGYGVVGWGWSRRLPCCHQGSDETTKAPGELLSASFPGKCASTR